MAGERSSLERRLSASKSSTTISRTRKSAPALERLEERQLLSGYYTGYSTSRQITSGGVVYSIAVTPGYEKIIPTRHGLAITLQATTNQSTFSITPVRALVHHKSKPLKISSLRIVSGQIGSINAPDVALNGKLASLSTSGPISLGAVTGSAQINLVGGAPSLTIGSIALTQGGYIHVHGALDGPLTVNGPTSLAGGSIIIDSSATGPLQFDGGLSVSQNGGISVGGADPGGISVSGPVSISSGGNVSIAGDLGGLSASGPITINGGAISIGQDLTGPVSAPSFAIANGSFNVARDATGAFDINQNMTISQNGSFNIGRDLSGGLDVGGNLVLDSGGTLNIGRELDNLVVTGNVTVTATGGGINVLGDVNTATIAGTFQGKTTNTGSTVVYPTVPDLNVGLNLNNFTVQNGASGQGGVRDAFIEAGKVISNLNIEHGLFDSFMYAGVNISGSIGPDGNDAVYNSEIRSAAQIIGFTVFGNVRSTFPLNSNSSGYPTRILAGEDLAGNWVNSGLIDKFQITGAMYDSVVAASVVPYGGDGALPSGGYGPPPTYNPSAGGTHTYDQPSGLIEGGTFGNPIYYTNYAPVNVDNQTNIGTAWATPNPDNAILVGAINPSFATAPVPPADQTPTQAVPVPTESTVLQGVYSDVHGSVAADYAGLFAADVRGVFIGPIPQ